MTKMRINIENNETKNANKYVYKGKMNQGSK